MQEFSTRFAAQESLVRAVQIECVNSAPKLCTKPSCSPQLGDYSRPVHQAQCMLNQPEKMLGMPLDGERTARLERAKHASPARLLQAEPSRKRRAATKAEPTPARARPEPGSPEAIALRLVTALGITPTLARFAAAFARNLKLRSACSDIGVGYETGRTYLKQIFLKTGTHSQAQLAVFLVGVLGDG